jgi:hypothetical protein
MRGLRTADRQGLQTQVSLSGSAGSRLDDVGRVESEASAVGESEVAAEDNLAELRRGQSKIEHLRAKKRALLEAYGNGMLLGIYLFTPSMRRAIYEMLQLGIFVSSTGMRVRSVVDANVVRMTREVEDYAARYLEVQVKGLPYEGGSCVDAWQAAGSPKRTDKVMAEVVS